MIIPPEEWLRELNRKFRDQDLHVRRRPFLAIEHYCNDFKVVGIAFDSPPIKAIFDWFYANTKAEAHQVGALFTGVFYFDSCFWPLDVLIGYGEYEVIALDSLQSMPGPLKNDLMAVPETAWAYDLMWADCTDYSFGIDDLNKILSADALYARSLLENADRELRSAVAQLLEKRPNTKAAMSCRMATEIFLKAFLVLRAQLPETEIRRFNHHLNKLLSKVREVDPEHDSLQIENELAVFPNIGDRYTGSELAPIQLWHAFEIALLVAASVIRSFTDRNLRATVLSKQNAC